MIAYLLSMTIVPAFLSLVPLKRVAANETMLCLASSAFATVKPYVFPSMD